MSYLLFISCLCQDKHYKNRVVLYFIPIDQNVPKARDTTLRQKKPTQQLLYPHCLSAGEHRTIYKEKKIPRQ